MYFYDLISRTCLPWRYNAARALQNKASVAPWRVLLPVMIIARYFLFPMSRSPNVIGLVNVKLYRRFRQLPVTNHGDLLVTGDEV